MISGIAEIIINQKIRPDYYRLVISAPEAAKPARPGQFLMLNAVGNADTRDPFLSRPMSLNSIDTATGQLGIIYQVIGRGTELMTSLKSGDTIKFSGPWGKGWQVDQGIKKAALVGGGAGIAPLLPLAVELKSQGVQLDIFLGAASRERLICEEEMASCGEIRIATDDGSRGSKCFAHELLPDKADYGMVYCCGPKPMMINVARWARVRGLSCQVSLEERMGCGFGVCAGCVCEAKTSEGGIAYKRICKEGPVFNAEEVFFND